MLGREDYAEREWKSGRWFEDILSRGRDETPPSPSRKKHNREKKIKRMSSKELMPRKPYHPPNELPSINPNDTETEIVSSFPLSLPRISKVVTP